MVDSQPVGRGWHRRGTLQDADNGNEYVSTETPGHITLLTPTDHKIVLSDVCSRGKTFLLCLPARFLPKHGGWVCYISCWIICFLVNFLSLFNSLVITFLFTTYTIALCPSFFLLLTGFRAGLVAHYFTKQTLENSQCYRIVVGLICSQPTLASRSNLFTHSLTTNCVSYY